MLEAMIRWPYEGEGGGKGVRCAVEVVPTGAGVTMKLNDRGEFEPDFDVDSWDAAKTWYFFPATKTAWKLFWKTLRTAARNGGDKVVVKDVGRPSWEPLPFPDVVRRGV